MPKLGAKNTKKRPIDSSTTPSRDESAVPSTLAAKKRRQIDIPIRRSPRGRDYALYTVVDEAYNAEGQVRYYLKREDGSTGDGKWASVDELMMEVGQDGITSMARFR